MSDETNAKAKKVLVVDDDESFRTTLKDSLIHFGYEVLLAHSGEAAEEMLVKERVDAVVTDIRMADGNGLDLVTQVRRKFPNTTVILMTGFAEVKGEEEAFNLGADGFLEKPFKTEDLVELLKKTMDMEDLEVADTMGYYPESEGLDDDYAKLNIDDFDGDIKIKYDVYVRLSKEKYIKISHDGEGLTPERLESYKKKGIAFLYLRKTDFKKYMGMNITMAPLVKTSKTIDKEKKISILEHTAEVILADVYLHGVNPESFEHARTVVESMTELITDDSDTLNLLTLLNTHTDFLYAHCLGVGIYAVMIAKAMHWFTPANIYKVSMGGLFHDVGKKDIPRETLAKPKVEFTPEELKQYENHPIRGVEILRQIPNIPNDILHIVGQHHENCLGQGFPIGLSKNRIHPMARLVAIANEFCNFAIKNPNSPGMNPTEAIKQMFLQNVDRFDPPFFMALMKLFKYDPPESFKKLVKPKV